MILNTNCYCSTAQNNSVNKAHVRGQNDSCAGMRMNNQDEDETKELRYHDSVLQREKLTCTKERRRAEGCTATKKGTDGVRGHQLVRESCNGKRQTVKRKCRGERVKEERGERWLPRQQQPAFSFFISPFCTHIQTSKHTDIHTHVLLLLFSLLHLICGLFSVALVAQDVLSNKWYCTFPSSKSCLI